MDLTSMVFNFQNKYSLFPFCFIATHSAFILSLFCIDSLAFETFDDHSGVHTIYWELHDARNPNITHGSGRLDVQEHVRMAPCS